MTKLFSHDLFSHDFLSPATWYTAGWTMVHFLWVGALLGIIAAALRLALRTAPANVRYTSMLTLLLAIAIAPLGIAWWLVQSDALINFASTSSHQNSITERTTQLYDVFPQSWTVRELHVGATPPPFRTIPQISASLSEPSIAPPFKLSVPSDSIEAQSTALALLNHCVAIIPWIWLIGTPLVFAWLALGLTGAERLRRGAVAIDDGPFQQACTRLARELRIRGRVTLAVCERIASPVLVGIVRPMILVPPAALTGYAPEEVEMVLLHELAHVRRWDNLVNLGQRVVEACLFFHPVVWLVSGWVRQEREACCDAFVVEHTAKPQAYAELLVNLAASRSPLAGVALARHPLAQRIRNILKLEDPPMFVSRKSLALFVVLLMTTVGAIMFYTPAQGEPAADRSRLSENEPTPSLQPLTPPIRQGEQVPFINSRPASPFPTLEEQKNADRAWKMLGLELEKIGEDDIKRVKKLGFEGGLKVAVISPSGAFGGRFVDDSERTMRVGDLLVGLHVWPTKRLTDVGTVLERPDLGELSPLKFYVVRRIADESGMEGGFGMEGGYGGMSGAPPPKFKDVVVTGRFEVLNLPKPTRISNSPFYSNPPHQPSSIQPNISVAPPRTRTQSPSDPRFVPPSSPYPPARPSRPGLDRQGPYRANRSANRPGTTVQDLSPQGPRRPETPKPTLLYDGKTFDQWRDQWRSELKTEKRMEAINALAAFGREGMGKEVSEEILDVAGNYDYSNYLRQKIDKPERQLRNEILSVLAGSRHTERLASVPTQAWLPNLLARLSGRPEKWEDLTVVLLHRLDIRSKGRQALIEPLTRHQRPKIRKAAKNALKQFESTESRD